MAAATAAAPPSSSSSSSSSSSDSSRAQVLYSCTDALQAAAAEALRVDGAAAGADGGQLLGAAQRKVVAAAAAGGKGGLTPHMLQALSQALRATAAASAAASAAPPTLYDLLQGSHPQIPDTWHLHKPAPRTPEQTAYLQQLRERTAEREYQSMIAGVTAEERRAKDPDTFSGLRDANAQIGMVRARWQEPSMHHARALTRPLGVTHWLRAPPPRMIMHDVHVHAHCRAST
jgi:hypothetical protein